MSGLERLNPALPPEAITAAVDELTRDRSAMSLEAANREVYLLLKEGIKVSEADQGDSTPHPNPTHVMLNHFHLVVETPKANLAAGMRWFLGAYTSRFNRRHKLLGHLFSGRYKSLIVDGR